MGALSTILFERGVFWPDGCARTRRSVPRHCRRALLASILWRWSAPLWHFGVPISYFVLIVPMFWDSGSPGWQ